MSLDFWVLLSVPSKSPHHFAGAIFKEPSRGVAAASCCPESALRNLDSIQPKIYLLSGEHLSAKTSKKGFSNPTKCFNVVIERVVGD